MLASGVAGPLLRPLLDDAPEDLPATAAERVGADLELRALARADRSVAADSFWILYER